MTAQTNASIAKKDAHRELLLEKAVKEKGFFGNQNTAARPKSKKWNHTVQRLKQRFGIDG